VRTQDRAVIPRLLGFSIEYLVWIFSIAQYHHQTRAGALLKIAQDQSFVDKENERSLLLLHYFGYLRRNPDDPPDRDLNGFNFWLQELAKHHDIGKIAAAFQNSSEFQSIKKQ
jgi:hypothetical protein